MLVLGLLRLLWTLLKSLRRRKTHTLLAPNLRNFLSRNKNKSSRNLKTIGMFLFCSKFKFVLKFKILHIIAILTMFVTYSLWKCYKYKEPNCLCYELEQFFIAKFPHFVPNHASLRLETNSQPWKSRFETFLAIYEQ